jgi:hypothetical protein
VIPEQVFSEADYDRCIYQQITKDIARFNGDDILDPVWVNSRGAMARFDRGSIEIRVMDIQECPAADVAIQRFVIESLRLLISEKLSTYEHQKYRNGRADIRSRRNYHRWTGHRRGRPGISFGFWFQRTVISARPAAKIARLYSKTTVD